MHTHSLAHQLAVPFHFTGTGAWDVDIKNVLDNGRNKVNQLHSVISNRDIN